jgi:hypothetical protein
MFAASSHASEFPVDRSVVVMATEISGNWGEDQPCPQNAICLDGPYEARFKTVRTIAGIGAPKEFNATVWLHVHPKRMLRLAFLLKHWPEDRWSILASSVEPCFDIKKVGDAGLIRDRTARKAGDTICFDGSRAK